MVRGGVRELPDFKPYGSERTTTTMSLSSQTLNNFVSIEKNTITEYKPALTAYIAPTFKINERE